MTDKLSIERLIEARCRQLGLSRAQLAQRLYHNTGKGQRRLVQLCEGRLEQARRLVARLPKGLEVSEQVIEQAMQETRTEIAEAERRAVAEENARWRAAFRPHATSSAGCARDEALPFPAAAEQAAAGLGHERHHQRRGYLCLGTAGARSRSSLEPRGRPTG